MLSIIVPVYKVEPYLDQCVESILEQGLDDFELLLIDDGSPDSCPQMCDLWAKKNRHIKVCHQDNGGLSAACNTGLDLAQGDLITFVDSDDTIVANTYAPNISILDTNKEIDILVFPIERDSRIVSTNTSETVILTGTSNIFRQVWYNHIPAEWSVKNKIFRSNVWKGVRFEKGRRSEDWLVTVQHLAERVNTACLSPFGKYIYNSSNPNSITKNLDASYIDDMAQAYLQTLSLMQRLEMKQEQLTYLVAAVIACAKECKNHQTDYSALGCFEQAVRQLNAKAPHASLSDKVYYTLMRLLGIKHFAKFYNTTHLI